MPRPVPPSPSAPRTPLKLGVWAGDENNLSFLNPLLDRLPERYEVVRMGEVKSFEEIEAGLKKVDVAFFEWASGPAAPGSRRAAHLPVVMRLHRYEAYSDWPSHIAWENVDDLIFVSEEMQRTLHALHPTLKLGRTREHVVHNGIDTPRYPFDPQRTRTFDLASVGRIHYMKNPMMLLQLMALLVQRDARYTLHIAGAVQQQEVYRYLRHNIARLGLEDNVKMYGRLAAPEFRALLNRCSYNVSTTTSEGHPVGMMEAMAVGLKPVIHDYPGAREQFPEAFVWNTLDEAVELITGGSFEPAAYRRFIEETYSFEAQLEHLTRIIDQAAARYYPGRMAAWLAPRAEAVDAVAAAGRLAEAQAHVAGGQHADALAALSGVDFSMLEHDAHVEAHVLGTQLALVCDAPTEALYHADFLTDLAPDEPLALNLAGRALWLAGQCEAALIPLVAAAERLGEVRLAPDEAARIRADAVEACTALGRPHLSRRFHAPAHAI